MVFTKRIYGRNVICPVTIPCLELMHNAMLLIDFAVGALTPGPTALLCMNGMVRGPIETWALWDEIFSLRNYSIFSAYCVHLTT